MFVMSKSIAYVYAICYTRFIFLQRIPANKKLSYMWYQTNLIRKSDREV